VAAPPPTSGRCEEKDLVPLQESLADALLRRPLRVRPREVGERAPAVLGMNQVVPCWSEALQLMKPGGKARITCPSDLAYGDRGLPGRILPGATLRFEIELLEVVPASRAKPAPAARSSTPEPAP